MLDMLSISIFRVQEWIRMLFFIYLMNSAMKVFLKGRKHLEG